MPSSFEALQSISVSAGDVSLHLDELQSSQPPLAQSALPAQSTLVAHQAFPLTELYVVQSSNLRPSYLNGNMHGWFLTPAQEGLTS